MGIPLFLFLPKGQKPHSNRELCISPSTLTSWKSLWSTTSPLSHQLAFLPLYYSSFSSMLTVFLTPHLMSMKSVLILLCASTSSSFCNHLFLCPYPLKYSSFTFSSVRLFGVTERLRPMPHFETPVYEILKTPPNKFKNGFGFNI